jgi:hypothetical protein
VRAALSARSARWPAHRIVALLAALICSLVLLTGAASAQTVSLTRDQAIELARRAYLSGDVVLAFSIASAIVEKDPKDVEALLLLSASNEAMGHPGEAFSLGKRSWFAANEAGRPEALRYEIALQTSRSALTAGQERRAAFWLERAVDIAPSDTARSRSANDLRQLQANIPLSFAASLTGTPTNNLNNGAANGLMIIDDQLIPGGSFGGWSVAHAGVVIVAGITANYSLGVAPSGKTRNALAFGLSTTLHELTPDEAAANPTLDASDLDLWRASTSWTHERILSGPGLEGRAPLRFTLEASQSWFGGMPYSPSLRAEVDFPLTQANNPKGDLTLVAVLERQWQDAPSGIVNGASLHLEGRRSLTLPWGPGQLAFGVGATVLRSDWINTTYDSLDASLSLDPGVHLGKAGVVLGMGVSWRKNDGYSLGAVNVTKGRTDRGLWLRAGLNLGDITLAGMTPTATVQRQMTWSNISKYQTDATSLYLGLAKEF